MRKWIDQSTFDELLLANAEDNIERAIRSEMCIRDRKYAEDSGMLSKLKFDINGDDFREGLTAVVSVVQEPQFGARPRPSWATTRFRPPSIRRCPRRWATIWRRIPRMPRDVYKRQLTTCANLYYPVSHATSNGNIHCQVSDSVDRKSVV